MSDWGWAAIGAAAGATITAVVGGYFGLRWLVKAFER